MQYFKKYVNFYATKDRKQYTIMNIRAEGKKNRRVILSFVIMTFVVLCS